MGTWRVAFDRLLSLGRALGLAMSDCPCHGIPPYCKWCLIAQEQGKTIKPLSVPLERCVDCSQPCEEACLCQCHISSEDVVVD